MSQLPLRTVVVAARKGGTGKTTLAVHLALAAYLRGYETVLVDADPQGSATLALRERPGAGPIQVKASASGLAALRGRSDIEKAERLVVDTPGASGPILKEAMSLADLVLLIARPTFLDIAAAVRTLAEARQLRVPSLIVLNQAPPARAGQEHASIK